MFEDRFYRNNIDAKNLVKFHICIDETDVFIFADIDLSNIAFRITRFLRYKINKYIQLNHSFLKTLHPVKVDKNAPRIIQDMQAASLKAGVGPMASVAGAIADFIGKALSEKSREIIVENGGDIFINTKEERLIQIYAGDSKLSGKLAIKIKPENSPLGICTSSRTVGHSLSFGIADACCVIAKTACAADAFATSVGNKIKDDKNIAQVLNSFNNYDEILGIVTIVDDKLACIGDIELVKV